MSISDRCVDGHSANKHIDEFNDLGIETPEQYKRHIDLVVETGECFTAYSTEQTWRQADVFYHESTNTIVLSPKNIEHEATAFRPEHGREDFERKHQEAERIEGREIEIHRGIENLEQAKVELQHKADITRQESAPMPEQHKQVNTIADDRAERLAAAEERFRVLDKANEQRQQERERNNSLGLDLFQK